MASKSKYPFDFKLPIPGSKLWYRCYVYRDLRSMRAADPKSIGVNLSKDKEKYVARVYHRGEVDKDGCAGVVVFSDSRMGAGVVAHEMGHIVLWHMMVHRKIKNMLKHDELHSSLLDALCSLFWNLWYVKGKHGRD